MLIFTKHHLPIADHLNLLQRSAMQAWEISNTAEKYFHKKSPGYDRSLNLDLVTFPLGKRLDQA
ncbi:hypothetical protein C5749_16945 [Sphingobacterium gobiense]|uniref:Uncharacterized protein n=1 Tax=Sphingobacterium gobiense TaxID=1382456 RepID=A0A2S9JGA1_9SPHI|nr:hypothetical protein C5749_16945 [Sphingobacterium gobiense]